MSSNCVTMSSIYAIQTKKEAHRFYTVLTQLNVKSCELHGDVTQALRYLALQRFRDNEVDVMVRITSVRKTYHCLQRSTVASILQVPQLNQSVNISLSGLHRCSSSWVGHSRCSDSHQRRNAQERKHVSLRYKCLIRSALLTRLIE